MHGCNRERGGHSSRRRHRNRTRVGRPRTGTRAPAPAPKGRARRRRGRQRHRGPIGVGLRTVAPARDTRRGTGHRPTARARFRDRQRVLDGRKRGGHSSRRRHRNRTRVGRPRTGAHAPAPAPKGRARRRRGRQRHGRPIGVGLRTVPAARDTRRGTGHRPTARANFGDRQRPLQGRKRGGYRPRRRHRNRTRVGRPRTGTHAPTPARKARACSRRRRQRHRRPFSIVLRTVAPTRDTRRGTGHCPTARAGFRDRQRVLDYKIKGYGHGLVSTHHHRALIS